MKPLRPNSREKTNLVNLTKFVNNINSFALKPNKVPWGQFFKRRLGANFARLGANFARLGANFARLGAN
jgi:hypothetical protein